MSAPTVSVVVTAHRRTKYLPDAFRSLERQTRPPDEVVIVEDNPPYGRPSVPPPDLPYQWVNRGDIPAVGDKDSLGISTARSDIVAFLEDDDRFAPTKLAHVAEVFGNHPEVVFFRNRLSYIGPSGEPIAPPSRVRFYPEGIVPPIPSAMSRALLTLHLSAMAVRKSAFLPALRFFDGWNTSPDILAYWISVYVGGSAWYSPQPLSEYRFHGENTSRRGVTEETLKAYALARWLVTVSPSGSPAFRIAQSIERSKRIGAALASGRAPGPGEVAGQAWDGVVRLSAIHFLRLFTEYRYGERLRRGLSGRSAAAPTEARAGP